MVLTLCLLAGCAGGEASPHASHRDGQWVWTAADSVLAAGHPRITPGVWVATIRAPAPAESLTQRLALPPTAAAGRPIAAVVRVDPSVHAWWAGHTDGEAARQFDDRLRALMQLLDRSGARVLEVQLDYDCPVRLLPRWARVLHRLRGSALRGREVWITSLVVHQRSRRFGASVRGAVDGQIVQLFDTGDPSSGPALEELERLVPGQGLPFRIGLASYERRLPGGTTEHTAWFGALGRFRALRGYRGLWIFPAGHAYDRLLAEGR